MAYLVQIIKNAATRVILRRRKYDFTDKLHHISQLYFGIKCVHPMASGQMIMYICCKHNAHILYVGDTGHSLAAAKEWNKLPYNVQSSKDLNIFKTKLKTHFLRCVIRNL